MLRALLSAALVAAMAVVAPAGPAASAPACAEVAAGESRALALAGQCRREVVVAESRTELTQVVARPDGRLTFESAVVPQRARTRGGGWADVDLRLARGADGRLRPAASVADVSFSGGDGPLISVTRRGQEMTLSWPEKLPEPKISGDSATYPGVLPGVDLMVRATYTGFTHTLVVRTAEAAANPAVRATKLTVGGDVALNQDTDGTLRATAGGAPVAEAAPALMWDSRAGSGARSTALAAGDVAKVARVRTEVSGKTLVLKADAKVLDAKDRVFPIFIDPDWSVFKSKWAYATNNGATNDLSSARVGRNPDSGALYRSYFAFPTTANGVHLGGKYIHAARVEMKLDHSWGCASTPSSLYHTSAINSIPKASWSGMALWTYLGEAWGSANEAGGCNPPRPDMYMNFQSANLNAIIQQAANDWWGEVNVALTARDSSHGGESVQARWKRFFPNDAKLVVDYDSVPTPPTGLQVAGVACPESGVLSVGTYTPTLSAILPDADSQTIMGYFEYVEVPASGNPDDATVRTNPKPDPVATANTRASTAPITIVQGKTYAFHVTSKDPAPYNRWSGWGPWCKFAVDTTVPGGPEISSTTPQGAGRPVTFVFHTTESDVVKFRYGWSSPPATEVAATTGVNKDATVTLTAPRFGKNTLWVRSIDATGNLGNLNSHTITVGRPSPPVASWGLETYPGITQAQALTDRHPGRAGDTPLASTGHSPVEWTDDTHLVGGKVAYFNRNSNLSTTTPIVNTTGSFSVAAWARLMDDNPATPAPDLPDGNRTVAGQSGTHRSALFFGYRIVDGQPRWGLYLPGGDLDPSGTTIASPNLVTTADIGRWVHLAAVYDAATKQMSLYVDGTLAGSRTVMAVPFNAAGAFTVGAALWSGEGGSAVMADHWLGQIADVQVFDRVLLAEDFTGQLASDPQSGGFNEPGILTPVQVGSWNFNAAVPCYDASVPDTCEAPDSATSFNRWLALSRGVDVGAGRTTGEAGIWLDDKYFPDQQAQVETTEEYGRSAIKTGGGWQDAPVLRTDQAFTVSAWVMPTDLTANRTVVAAQDATAITYDAAAGRWRFRLGNTSVDSAEAPDANVWTHLAAAHDAGRKQIRLYVNGKLSGTKTLTAAAPNVSGRLLVGRGPFGGQWTGGVDEVAVFQGALTDTTVATQYQAQIGPEPGANALLRGTRLNAGDSIPSDVGDFELRMQSDGNLVVAQGGTTVWDTRTWGNPGAYCYVQSDGNFVVYRSDGTPLWDTRTWGTGADRLLLKSDGDLLLQDAAGRVLWRRA
ncbi:LamG-like jellyroll fold domain-containing protein [Actinoplanes aureus]|uniref:LamG-like jellyroll fold domain-containing protein n=1 Tax=Actinoplanes aureus TaxID=2792083 RepID=UPI001E44B71E|nr:LamG-like jellyroll fold domain-containing protein [Actinoplanes aureus]